MVRGGVAGTMWWTQVAALMVLAVTVTPQVQVRVWRTDRREYRRDGWMVGGRVVRGVDGWVKGGF